MNGYEWATIIISGLSLIIASIAFIFFVLTYRKQKKLLKREHLKTAINDINKFNDKVFELLNFIISDFAQAGSKENDIKEIKKDFKLNVQFYIAIYEELFYIEEWFDPIEADKGINQINLVFSEFNKFAVGWRFYLQEFFKRENITNIWDLRSFVKKNKNDLEENVSKILIDLDKFINDYLLFVRKFKDNFRLNNTLEKYINDL